MRDDWETLRQDMTFDANASTTTDPFSIALDVAWYDTPEVHYPMDACQTVIAWYSGIWRGATTHRSKHAARSSFMPIRDVLKILPKQRRYDLVAIRALELFEALWTETKSRQPKLRAT